MAGLPESGNRPRISPIDRRGRLIDPVVLSAAEELAGRVLRHAEQVLRDPAVAISLLEESAASASRVVRLRRNPHQEPIRDLRAYLFRAFIRRVSRVARRERRLAARLREQPRLAVDALEQLELQLQVEEILARCDPEIKDMFHRRVQGFSWREIGEAYGTSAHAAESRFSAALARIRKRLGMTRDPEAGQAGGE